MLVISPSLFYPIAISTKCTVIGNVFPRDRNFHVVLFVGSRSNKPSQKPKIFFNFMSICSFDW